MTALLANPAIVELFDLCNRMCAEEKDQFCAATGAAVYDPEAAARVLVGIGGWQFCLLDDAGAPVAAGGFVEVRPMVWQSWMVVAEGGWESHWRELTKSCRRMMKRLFGSGKCHRIETVALASRTKAGRWYMKALGERFEGVARAWFPDGRDAAIYAKVKE
jgi:hypothetical protein